MDEIANKYALKHHLEIFEFLPAWHTHGKHAGIIRNIDMAEFCDIGIAIWDGTSKGTKHAIDCLKERNKLLEVFKK